MYKVNNDFLEDEKLSWNDKGLLITLLNLPDSFDFSIKEITKLSPDGEYKTRKSLNNLERYGYLKRSRIYKNGKVFDWMYEVYHSPVFLDNEMEGVKKNEQ